MSNKNLKKIKNILSDVKSSINEFDIVFMIDATTSMGSYIEAAKAEAKNISTELSQKFPKMDFQYGYVFYRDPIDSPDDIHEIINLTNEVDSLPEKISKIYPYGGADIPEDWAGAYKIINEQINWRNGNKAIFHLADAGAHGNLFSKSDAGAHGNLFSKSDAGAHGNLFSKSDYHPEEESKLIKELEILAPKKIKIFGFVIEEEARNSFEQCKKIYQNKGGVFEIYNFNVPKKSLFGNSGSLFGNNDKDSNIKKSTSLFSNANNINNNSGGLFSNSNNLFGKNSNENENGSLFSSNYNNNSIFGKSNINNHSENIFANNNNQTNSLFGNFNKNSTSQPLFANNNTTTTNSLFGNQNINNNNSQSLFSNNNNNNFGSNSLFGNNSAQNNNCLFSNENKTENSFQSNVNSVFRNLVVNSIKNMSNKNN